MPIEYAYRMTHIDNIEDILNVGLVRSSSPKANPSYVSIGDKTAIETRKHRVLADGSNIGEYIPFYFGPRTPMLYVIQNGYNNVQRRSAEEIVYCVIAIRDILETDIPCIFTDGHALNKISKIYPKKFLSEIDKYVNFKDVYIRDWNDAPDAKRLKEAELLIKADLDAHFIRYFLVYNEEAKQKLLSLRILDSMIRIVPQFYF